MMPNRFSGRRLYAMDKRLALPFNILGRLIYLAVTSLIIWMIGGGVSFCRSPVGMTYLILWNIWWIVTFLGRRKGDETPHDMSQKWLVILSGVISVPFLILVPPWEFASFPGPIPRAGITAWIRLILFAIGIIMQSIAMWQLRSYYTVRLGVQPGQHLVMTGLYRRIRHPGYLSYLISMLGIGLAMSSLGMLVFLIPIFFFIRARIRSEEKMLLEEFGEEYAEYMRRTQKLIPFVY
jgi:protein-S-isoprenylcysteine O-methyltransferase Ste14